MREVLEKESGDKKEIGSSVETKSVWQALDIKNTKREQSQQF